MSKKKQKKTRRKKKEEEKRTPVALHAALCLVIFIGSVAVYINTLHYPFQFDDLHRIVDNQHIRSFSSMAKEYRFFSGNRTNDRGWADLVAAAARPALVRPLHRAGARHRAVSTKAMSPSLSASTRMPASTPPSSSPSGPTE